MKRLSRNKKRLIAILIIEVIIAINVFATFAADYVIDEHAGENKDQIELVQVVATEEEAKEIRDAVPTPDDGSTPDTPAVEVNAELVGAIDEFNETNDITEEFAVYADNLEIYGGDHIEGNIAVNVADGNGGDIVIKGEDAWSGHEKTTGTDDYSIIMDTVGNGEIKNEAGATTIVTDEDSKVKDHADEGNNPTILRADIDSAISVDVVEGQDPSDDKAKVVVGSKDHSSSNEGLDSNGNWVEQYEEDVNIYGMDQWGNVETWKSPIDNQDVIVQKTYDYDKLGEVIAEKLVDKGDNAEYTEEQLAKIDEIKKEVRINDNLHKLVESGKTIQESVTRVNTTNAISYLYQTGSDGKSIISTLTAEDTVVLKFKVGETGTLDFGYELSKLRDANINNAKIIVSIDSSDAPEGGVTVVNKTTGGNGETSEKVHSSDHNTIIFSFGDYKGTVTVGNDGDVNSGVFIAGDGTIKNCSKIQGRIVADTFDKVSSNELHQAQKLPTPSPTEPGETPTPTPSEPNETPSTPVETPSEPNESPSEVVSPSPLVVDLKVEKTVETPADRPWLEDEEFEFKLHVFEKTANTSIDLSGIGVEKDANGEYNEVSIMIGKDKPIDTFGQLVFKAPLTKEEAIQDGFWDQTSWHKDNGTQEVKDKINTDGTEIWMSRVYIRVKEVVDETLEQAGWGFDKMIHSIKVFFNVSYTDGKLDKQWVEVREAIDEEYTNDVKSDKFFWTKGEGEAVATDPASTVAPGGDNHGINNECDDFGEKMTFKNVLTVTPTPTPSESAEEKPSTTPSEPAKVTPTPSGTPEESASTTPSGTPEESASATPSGTPEESASATPSGTPEVTPSETPDETPSPSAPADETPSPSAPADETPSPSAPADETPSPSAPADETPSPSAPTEEVPSPSAPADEIVPPPPFVPEVPETPAEVLGARRVQGGGTVLGARRGLDKAVLGKRRAPQTGDSIAIFLWIAALAATMGGAVVSAVALKKTK